MTRVKHGDPCRCLRNKYSLSHLPPMGLVGSLVTRAVFSALMMAEKPGSQSGSFTQDFVNRDWEAVSFNSNGIGLAVGENSTLALTTDNGKTWQLETSITGDHLRAVRLQDSSALILGAQKPYFHKPFTRQHPTSQRQIKPHPSSRRFQSFNAWID